MRRYHLALAASLFALLPVISHAQTTGAPENQTAITPNEGLIEVIVTAQRKRENLQKAGIPVDVITSDTLVKNGVTDALSLNKAVPSLSVQAAGGANTIFFLRGVGNFTVNGYTDPAIGFNYDEVYLGRPTSTAGMFYDLERLEVLKGPQGTLYGRNATAGAINVIPAKPVLHQTSGFVTANIANYDEADIQGAINLPIGETTAVRLSGNSTKHSGYLSDGTSDDSNQALRFQVLSKFDDSLTVRLAIDYAHTGGKGGGASYGGNYIPNFVSGGYTYQPSGLDMSKGLLDPAAQAYRQGIYSGQVGRTFNPLDGNIYQNNTYRGASAHIDWKLGAGTLSIVPAVRTSRLDNRFVVPAFTGLVDEHDKQSSLEIRFDGKRVGIFDYLIGAYAFDETVAGHYVFSQQVLAPYQDVESKTRSTALFGRVTANLTDRFRLIAGARYTSDRKRFNGKSDLLIEVCTVRVMGVPMCPTATLLPVTYSPDQLPAPFILPPSYGGVTPVGASGAILIRSPTTVNTSQDNDKSTYRLAAEYDVFDHSLLYASVETGYRSGGFALAAGHETFSPEYITAYTLGMKNRFLENRLQLNIESFVWKYRDQQVNHLSLDVNGNQAQYTDNVGRSTNKGVEIDSRFLATPNTMITAGLQLLDAKYDSFVYTQPTLSLPNVGCKVTVNAANTALYDIDCSGKPAFQSPKITFNMGVEQTFPLGDNQIVASIDTQYKSARYVGFEYLPSEYVSANWISNAQISYGPASADWSVTAYVRNIENKRVVVGVQYFPAANSAQMITTPPRIYGVRLNRKF